VEAAIAEAEEAEHPETTINAEIAKLAESCVHVRCPSWRSTIWRAGRPGGRRPLGPAARRAVWN